MTVRPFTEKLDAKSEPFGIFLPAIKRVLSIISYYSTLTFANKAHYRYTEYMKIWIKYIIGIVLGILAGLILPTESPAVQAAITSVSEFVMHFGRYTLLPLIYSGSVQPYTPFVPIRTS